MITSSPPNNHFLKLLMILFMYYCVKSSVAGTPRGGDRNLWILPASMLLGRLFFFTLRGVAYERSSRFLTGVRVRSGKVLTAALLGPAAALSMDVGACSFRPSY